MKHIEKNPDKMSEAELKSHVKELRAALERKGLGCGRPTDTGYRCGTIHVCASCFIGADHD